MIWLYIDTDSNVPLDPSKANKQIFVSEHNVSKRKAKDLRKDYFTENEKRRFKDIDRIVSTLVKHNTDYTEEEVLRALKKNSFNILNTYNYLQDEDKFEGTLNNIDKCFYNVDDYVLTNFKKTKFYNQLVNEKGKSRVEEREFFLNVN